ncbi:MAG: hypothetical protein ACMUIG_03160 [Thermoplasmatota archaeon]
MTEFDFFIPLSESAVALCLIIFIILFLIPSNKKIREGKVTNINSTMITVFMVIGGALVIINPGLILIGEYSEEYVQPSLFFLWMVILAAFILTIVAYYRAKKLVRKNMEGDLHQPHEPWTAPAAPQVHTGHHPHAGTSGVPHHHQAPQHHAHAPQHHAPAHTHHRAQEPAHPQPHAGMMTVECPQCGGHLEIPVGSHTITCPYCGLSGSM